MQKLKIHENGKYIQYEDGTPFFYQGDTSWDMFQHLTKDEVELYMSVRAEQKFNVLQCILLGGTEPYDYTNKYGRHPIKPPFDKLDYDTDGEYSYWDHVDFCLDCAEKYGIYIAVLPMWNGKYNEPDNTLFTGYQPAYDYGKWLAERIGHRNNIIWMLGGDVEVKPYMHEIFDGLAAGIKAGEGDNTHLMTFHPRGASNTVRELGCDKEYLDFLCSQSGHTVDWSYEPEDLFPEMAETGKPFLDAEAHYEDHVANWAYEFKRWDGADIREGAYRSIFAGASGQTYGNPIVAFFLYEPLTQYRCPYYIGNVAKMGYDNKGWHHALRHEGADTLKYLQKLRLSRPYFDLTPAPELVLNSEDDMLFGKMSAAMGKDYAFIYSPHGREIKVDGSLIKTQFLRASWYNPRTGEEKLICYLTPRKAVFVPETRGKGQDWVLILDGGKRDWVEVGQLKAEDR